MFYSKQGKKLKSRNHGIPKSSIFFKLDIEELANTQKKWEKDGGII